MIRRGRSGAVIAVAASALALFAALPAAAETLLIGNKGENTVSFIDLATGQERARVETGSAPHEIAISPNGKQAATVAYGGSTIDVFDIASTKLVKRIDIAPEGAPHGIVWLRNGKLVVAAEKNASVVIVDPRRGTSQAIPTGQSRTHMVAVSPDQRTAYAANVGSGTVSIIDLRRAEKVGDIAVGGNPEGLALTRDGRQLWVGNNAAPQVNVVDLATRKVVATLPTDPVAIRVAISPDGKTAVTSNIGTGTLSLFDVAAQRATKTITVGDRAAMQVTIAFTPDSRRLYVAETGRSVIAEVDLASGTVLRRITAGKNGDGLAVAP